LSTTANILSSRTDHVRIVPPKLPPQVTAIEGAAPPPGPHLTYNSGPLLTNVEVFAFFWGSEWTKKPLSDLEEYIEEFFEFIVKKTDNLSEYSVPPKLDIEEGKFAGSIDIGSPAPTTIVSDGAIQHFLKQEISTNSKVPKPNANTLYYVYLPPGVTVNAFSCNSCGGTPLCFCGYHDVISGTSPPIYYAVMPYPGCGGCLAGLSVRDALTTVSSHEFCESITDPIPGQGWYDFVLGAEIGDICAWQTKKLGTFMVQLEWSNNANSCV
jgi:hypothetical protein